MTDGKSGKDLLNRLKDFLQGLGKPKDTMVLRGKSDPSSEQSTSAPLSDNAGAANLAPVSPGRINAQTPKSESNKEQWQKLKHTAKESDSGESNLDHWNQKQGGILSGTTFDAATTDLTRTRKRPSVVTQARITSNRLQALQAKLESPKNDIDQHEEESA